MKLYLLPALAMIAATSYARPAKPIDTNIKNYVCAKLDDFTATLSTIHANERELGKISKDGAMLYKLSDVTMRYKEPNKVRIEGNLEGAKGLYVYSGNTQWVSIPRIKLKTKRVYDDEPGKRKSLIDVGIVSDYYLGYTNVSFVREATVDGVPCAVFETHYKGNKDTSHQVLYIDPKTKVVRKREAYSQAGKFQATYFYKDVKEVAPGIWFPTVVEAQNVDRVLAGSTAYKDIKVNTGLSDDLFKL